MKHHNLKDVQRAFLINTLTTEDFGVYTDTIKGKSILNMKRLGLSIPFAGAHGNPVVTKVCSDDGQVRVVGTFLDDVCPCEECRTNYGIQINKYPEKPGVFNSQAERSLKGYGGVDADPLQCVSGLIPGTKMEDMVDDIINQINADIGFSNPDSGSGAHAGKMHYLTGFNAGDTVTINGTAYTGATRALLIAAINAGTDAFAFAGTIASTLYIIANATPTTFVVTAGGMIVHGNWGIGLIANDVDTPIDITFSEEVDIHGTTVVIQEGFFASLTPEEVFAEFTNKGHHGSLTANIYRELPIEDAHYCKYNVEWNDTVDSLNSGANNLEHRDGSILIYIRESVLATNVWDASNLMWESTQAGFAADTTFDELLGLWGYNPAVTGDATVVLSNNVANGNGALNIILNGTSYLFPIFNGQTVDTIGQIMAAVFAALPQFADSTWDLATRTLTISGPTDIISGSATLSGAATLPTFTFALV